MSAPAATVTPASASVANAVRPRAGAVRSRPRLQEQVGLRQGHHPDPGGGHLVGDAVLDVEWLHPETHAVAGDHRVREPRSDHDLGQVLEIEGIEPQVLVGVQVDRQSPVGGDLEQPVGCGPRVVIEVRCPADNIEAPVERIEQCGSVPGAGPATGREADQTDELEFDPPGQRRAGLDQGIDRGGAGVGTDVDVGSDRGGPVGEAHERRPGGPFEEVGVRDRPTMGDPGPDRPTEITVGVGDPIGGQRLVEMGVGLGRGRQHQITLGDQRGAVDGRSESRSRTHRWGITCSAKRVICSAVFAYGSPNMLGKMTRSPSPPSASS